MTRHYFNHQPDQPYPARNIRSKRSLFRDKICDLNSNKEFMWILCGRHHLLSTGFTTGMEPEKIEGEEF